MRTRTKVATLLTTFVLLGLAAGGLGYVAHSQQPEARTEIDTMQEVYDLAPGGSVCIETIYGDVHVGTWEGPGLWLETRKAELKSDSVLPWRNVERDSTEIQAYLNAMELEVTRERDAIHFKTRHPGDGRNILGALHYALHVPAHTAVTIDTVVGDIVCDTLDGALTAATVEGNVHVGDVTGAVEIHAVDGDVSVEDVHAGLSVDTFDGDVSVAISDDVFLREGVACATVHGDIDVTLPNETDLNDDKPSLDLASVDGSIYIHSS
jgi:hypothetical protein